MIRGLKFVNYGLALVAIIATAFFLRVSGIAIVIFTCCPFLFFVGAAALGKSILSECLTLMALIAAIAIGIKLYHEAFWVHNGGDADGIAIIVTPAMQAVFGIFVLIVAFIGWAVNAYKRYRKPRTNDSKIKMS